MTDLTFYNDDPRYELMATIIEDANCWGGDAEPFKEDYLHILRLCYAYTIDDKSSARELAEMIVAYLHGTFRSVTGFQEFARAYWTPSKTPSDTGSDRGTESVGVQNQDPPTSNPLTRPTAYKADSQEGD